MPEANEMYRKSVLPLIIALCFLLLKRLAEKRRPALEDTNDVAWTLIMMSGGAAAVYAREWTAARSGATFAWIVILALVLLFNRRGRMRNRVRGVLTRDPISSRRIVVACAELAARLAAVVITTR
jgi:predicted Na+-dependent transporter